MEDASLTKEQILLCARYEFHQAKPVEEAYQNFCKTMGDEAMTYRDFDFWWYRFKNGEFDLDYDRSKDPETHEFSDFPVEIVKKIVEKLEWNEKLVLRNVSKGLRETVDNSKVHYECMHFGVMKTHSFLSIDREFVNYPKGTNWEQGFNNLAIVLKWPKMKMHKLYISFEETLSPEEMSHAVKEIKNIFSSLDHQISTKRVFFQENNLDGILAVLPYLKPGFLETIHVYGTYEYKYLNFNEIVKLDQWKKAKDLNAWEADCPIESFLHSKRFVASVRKMSIEEFVELKNTFLASPNLEYCHVKVDDSRDFELIHNAFESETVIPIPETNRLLEIVLDLHEAYDGFVFEKLPRTSN